MVLLCIWHITSHSGSGSRFMSKISFLRNFVNSAHTDMYDTSNESCAQGLYFFFLHRRAQNNLWGRYDPKIEKSRLFASNWVISSHRIMCNASIESSHPGLHCVFLHWWTWSNIWGRYDQKNMKMWWFNSTFSSLIHCICSKWLVLETTNWWVYVDFQGEGEGEGEGRIGIF